MKFTQAYSLIALLGLPFTQAIHAPGVKGMKLVWQDDFAGGEGSHPGTDKWNTVLHQNTNNDIQDYTSNSKNLQLSGGQTLQITPRLKNGQWTSARIETKGSWTPKPGKKTRYQASLRMGSSPNKQGMWPAFWMLGDSMRHGTPWPTCGELDIFEQVNGISTGYGTAHCSTESGGICNEPQGRGGNTQIANNGDFHTWTLVIDRKHGNDWRSEKIKWMLNGNVYHTLSGADIGDQATWSTLAHSPFYMILNIAIGGTWPGNPNGATDGGAGNMMEVQYVAVYETA